MNKNFTKIEDPISMSLYYEEEKREEEEQAPTPEEIEESERSNWINQLPSVLAYGRR